MIVKSIYIMAGGPTVDIPDVDLYEKPSIWVGVDKGISTLLAKGITPDVVFGDFDSVNQVDLAFINGLSSNRFQYPSEKDDTDLGLAVQWSLEQQPDFLYIFGNTGGRMDHTMGGIHLLLDEKMLKSQTKIHIIDRCNKISAVLPGSYEMKRNPLYTYISFFSMSAEVKGITLTGFKYPLENKDISLGSTLCISNELISESGTFSFKSGILLVIRSTDN